PPPPSRPPLFPYTTLFRSRGLLVDDPVRSVGHALDREVGDEALQPVEVPGEERAIALAPDHERRDGQREPRGLAAEASRGDSLGDRKSTRLNSSHQIISYA